MVQHDHVIAQCQWQTQFDEIQEAVVLQNSLSQWSEQVLPGILSTCFDQHCPAAQIWRIEQLEVDLGQISLRDLDRELPIRLKTALEDALMRLFSQQKVTQLSVGIRPLRILDQQASALEQIRWYLRQGTSPWWGNERDRPVSLIDQQIETHPQSLAELLREVGDSASVRRRIVWQWGEPRMRRVIAVLEPWHADFIHRYADNLALSQQRDPFVNTHYRELKSSIWYWILTHLLVERGTLFNTLQFVRSTLKQMAQHYRLDLTVLIHRLSDVARQMQSTGLMAPQFLQVLVLLDASEPPSNAEFVQEDVPDLWQVLQQMLHRREARHLLAVHPVYLSELFVRLARIDAGRAAQIMRHEGRAESVRLHLLNQFDQEHLHLLVEVVAPGEHPFILTHVRHTQTMLREQHLDPQLIWRVLLAYLLANSGSYFNRRQLVQTTLMDLSRQHHLEYTLLLAMLVQTSLVWQLTPQHFELLAILQELQSLQEATQTETDVDRLIHWIQYGTPHGREDDVRHGAESAPCHDPIRMLGAILRLQPALRHRTLVHLLQQSTWRQMSPEQLSWRIMTALETCDRLDLSDLRALLTACSPQAGQTAFLFLMQLHQWQSQGSLPRLPTADPIRWLNALMVEALVVGLMKPKLSPRWRERLLSMLQRESGFSIRYWDGVFRFNAHLASSDTGAKAMTHALFARSFDGLSFAGLSFSGFSFENLSFDRLFDVRLDQTLRNGVRREMVNSGALPDHDWGAWLSQYQSQQLTPSTPLQAALPVVIMVAVMVAIIEHPDAVRLLMRLDLSRQGQSWLAPLMPAQLRHETARQQLWHTLVACVGELGGDRGPAQLNRLQQCFWHIWAGALRGYWQQHHRLDGFSLDLSAWVADLLRLWSAQQHVQLAVLAVQIRQQRQLITQSSPDWSQVLKRLQMVPADAGFIPSVALSEPLPVSVEPLSALRALRGPKTLKGQSPILRETLRGQSPTLREPALRGQSPTLRETLKGQSPILREPQPALVEPPSALRESQSASTEPQLPTLPQWFQDAAGHYLTSTNWVEWLVSWLRSGQRPADLPESAQIDWRQGIRDWIHFYPEQFRQRVAPLIPHPAVRCRLRTYVTLSAVLDAMVRSSRPIQAEIQTIQVLRQCLQHLNLAQVTRVEWEQHLLSGVLDAWLGQDWSRLTPDALVSELFWRLLRVGAVTPALLTERLRQPGLVATYALRQAIDVFVASLLSAKPSSSKLLSSKSLSPESLSLKQPSAEPPEHGLPLSTDIPDLFPTVLQQAVETTAPELMLTVPISVFNAGLVLVQSFIPAFFERLHLTQDNQFISPEKQRRAIHCLQALATGVGETEEYYLVLNKVLCGVPLCHPVESGIDLYTEDFDVIHSLVEAVINYWPAIGKTSIDGFRGNWLVRHGTLTESQDHWDLIVEKRPYDVLIARAPLSYSIIRLPWMNKPIYVTWPT